MGRMSSYLACIIVNDCNASELWKYFKLRQSCATLLDVLRGVLCCLTSLPCDSRDADDKRPLIRCLVVHVQAPISVLGLSWPSWAKFLSGVSSWISLLWSTSRILIFSSLSSGLQVPNWYLPLRWKYTSDNLLTFKLPRHKLDHCMCHSNSPSALQNPFPLVLKWSRHPSLFPFTMGLTAHLLSLSRNSLLILRLLTFLYP